MIAYLEKVVWLYLGDLWLFNL